MKVQNDSELRAQVASEASGADRQTAQAIHERVQRGGKLILFGNGGSATDANDWAIDCVLPPAGYQPIPAVSLSMEPANITAVANDIGTEAIFLRQLIAQARPEDVAVGISTSGGSRNIIMALEEARKRGLLTVALLGYDGGEILRRGLADLPIVVHCDYIPAHSGSAGVHLSHHSRDAGGAAPWRSLSCLEPRAAPIRRRCGSGWSGSAAISWSMMSMPTPWPPAAVDSGERPAHGAGVGRRGKGRADRLARPRLCHRRGVTVGRRN